MLRRNKDRDERLKTLQDEAAALSEQAKRLEQQRAQLEAELAEAHRERCCSLRIHHITLLSTLNKAVVPCSALRPVCGLCFDLHHVTER